MKLERLYAPGLLLVLIVSLLSVASCSGIIFVEDCKLVTRNGAKTYWKCKK